MSYRNFKHVLGETSLERKCRFLFGACLLLLITLCFWWYGRRTESLVNQQDRQRGRLLVDTIMALHHFKTLELTDDFRKTILGPLIEDMQSHEYDWTVIRRSKTDNTADTRDGLERDLWQRFAKLGPPQPVEGLDPMVDDPRYHHERYSLDRGDEGRAARQMYEYYQPIYATTVCIDCHRTTGAYDPVRLGASDPLAVATTGPPLTEGDLMAVVKVRIPNGPTQRQLNVNRAWLWATAIITVFLAMIASWVIVRYVIVKPLTHLRDVSDAISHGNIDLRAEIHTGDEFEALGVAFNRMLRHMVAAQEELRNLNIDLDQKVDELAQVNLRLFEMNRLKSDFLATMSHELRTPLNSIIGFSDVLGSIDSLDDRQKRYVQNIKKSGKVLLDMINDILDLAKIESGKAEVRLSEFRIESVVSAQCDMARPLSERKNIDLEVEIEPGLPELRQDQGKVQQILNNLLSNAIKFTPEGGRIVVAARRDKDHLALVVTDTGVGIAEEDQKHIFEKFRQGQTVLPAGDAMTREYSGTGLGLSIVKELCKLLGGEVALHSELGKGVHRPPALDFDRPAQGRNGVARWPAIGWPLAPAGRGIRARRRLGHVGLAVGAVEFATPSSARTLPFSARNLQSCVAAGTISMHALVLKQQALVPV
jgi:two-component system, NarL family, sensor histidine kinase BarA